MTLPVFKGPNGLPVGLQVIARRNEDRKLFSAAQLAKGVNLAAEFPQNPTSPAFARIWKAGAEKQALEGRQICIDIINEIRDIKGVAGIHVMAYRQEETVAEIIQKSGVLAGREPWHPQRDVRPVQFETDKETP